MQKSLNIDPGKCTGCLQCEMACSYEHTGTFNPSRSYIKVFTFHYEGRFAPYTCTQCDEAWCMRACPVDAISVDMATGAKVVSDDKCVGCKVCTIACPFGTINYSQATVVATRNAQLPVRPPRSPTWTRTGPVTTV
jgi:Fe-S-cluster-containing hydrogenase component 2